MLNFELGKAKLISNTTSNGAPIELSAGVKLIIRNSGTGLYWDDNNTFVSSPFLFTLLYDSVAKYYYYANSNLILTGLYEAIFVSDDVEMPFREVEQFLLADTVANDVWNQIAESGYTFAEVLRIVASVLAGKAIATQSPNRVIYKGLDESTDRANFLHSDDGDRTEVTLDGS